jgi:hypothetical protein
VWHLLNRACKGVALVDQGLCRCGPFGGAVTVAAVDQGSVKLWNMWIRVYRVFKDVALAEKGLGGRGTCGL